MWTSQGTQHRYVSGNAAAIAEMLEPLGFQGLRVDASDEDAGEISSLHCGGLTLLSLRLTRPACLDHRTEAAAVYLSASAGLALELTKPSQAFALEDGGVVYQSRSLTRVALRAGAVLRGVVFADDHRATRLAEDASRSGRIVRYARAQAQPIDRFLDFILREGALETGDTTAAGLSRQAMTLADLILDRAVEQARPVSNDWGVAPGYLKRAEEYVRRNLAGDLSMERIAVAAGVSRRSLHRAFQEFRGLSLGQFVRNARMEAARQLVSADPTLSLKAAARTVGYGDYTSFWRHYRAKFGKAPSARSEPLAA